MIFDPSKETRPEVLAAEEEYFGCKPCFEKGRNRHVFQSGFNAGAASRAEQIASLKDELRQMSTVIDDVLLDLTNTAAELIMEMKEQLASRDAEVAELKQTWSEWQQLEQQLAESNEEHGRACHLVAQMHAAAVGEVTGPKRGVVEDVADLRQQLTDSQKREVMLRDALNAIAIEIATENLSAITVLKKCFRMADEALAATKPKEQEK